MKRGDIVTVAVSGDYGKPRPAVVIQSDWLKATDSVLVALMTSALADAPIYRLTLEPDATNGLRAPTQVMVDKIVAVPRAKCGKVVGKLDEKARIALDHMVSVVVGLAD
ncbi:MAG: type II toxin-antitoxin system PemK/MazF family toxin [Rhodoblastus sp.]|nr:type II toxin-antitoxin system PemK/MazF family toxin [Rhodoblastus sp.]